MFKFTLLAVSVIGLSSLSALANQPSTIPILSYHFEAPLFRLHISGQFNNSCQSRPAIEVRNVDEKGIVHLQMTSVLLPKQFCSQSIWGSYDVVVDLRALELPANKPLNIVLDNLTSSQPDRFEVVLTHSLPDFEKSADIREGIIVPMRTFARDIAMTSYGLKTAQGIIALRGTNKMNEALDSYLNTPVQVRGLPLQQTVLNSSAGVQDLEIFGSSGDTDAMAVWAVSSTAK